MAVDIDKLIPKKIKIGNRTVEVKFKKFDDGLNAMGMYDPNNFRILISADLKDNNPTQIVETFWHELIHAVNDAIRFNAELTQEMDDKDTIEQDAWKFEEKITESFARTFLQVIQDNNLLPIADAK